MSETEQQPRPDIECRKCGVKGQVTLAIWTSFDEAYEDDHYRCKACGGEWWIDGPDY